MATTKAGAGTAHDPNDDGDFVLPAIDHAGIDTSTADIVVSPATVSVELPAAPIHDIPEDELAVALDDDGVALPAIDELGVDTVTADAVVSPATVSVELPAAPIHDISEDELDAFDDDETVEISETAEAVDAAEPEEIVEASETAEVPEIEVEAPATPPVPVIAPPAPVAAKAVEPEPLPGISARRYQTGAPESSALLTTERLLDDNSSTRVSPEGFWQKFLYDTSFGRINLGDSAIVRERKELSSRIRTHLDGGARFVPILTRKGGVGKTTVTALLGMALADARDDRIIAIDANPDRGTLSERIAQHTEHTVRDVVRDVDSIRGYSEFSSMVARDETRLDVLASDTDPLLSEAFDEHDYEVIAALAAQYYSIVLTDCGTGIVHSVMRPTLRRADSVVIVSGSSVDEARLASETLTWLERNGYEDLVKNAIVALNTATQGSHMVRLDEIESHFKSRVREIVRIPYDPQLAAGSSVSFKDLKPSTRHAARTLAALVVEGLAPNRAHESLTR